MIEIVDYVPFMAKEFRPRKGDEVLPYMIQRLRNMKINNEAVAFYKNDEILALCCIFEEHQGMWQLVVGFSYNAFEQSKKELIKRLKFMLNITFARDSIRRLQTYVIADSEINIRFAEWMGFFPSGYLEKWGPDGEDYWLMARVK